MGEQIIDATVVPAPKQRNTEEEKTAIKEGRIPDRWKDKPAKVRQKDRDARWNVKYTKAKVKEGADPKAFKPVDLAIPMYGYKNHIGIDRVHGLIRTWDASAANAHDGARLPDLVSRPNTASGVWADTAYRSKKNEAFLAKGMFKSNIHQRKPHRGAMPDASRPPMPSARPCARRSSTCSPDRSIAWACSYAPSAWPVPASRSAWRIWPIISSGSLGSRGVLRPRDGKQRSKSDSAAENQQKPTGLPSRRRPAHTCRCTSLLNRRFFEVSNCSAAQGRRRAHFFGGTTRWERLVRDYKQRIDASEAMFGSHLPPATQNCLLGPILKCKRKNLPTFS